MTPIEITAVAVLFVGFALAIGKYDYTKNKTTGR
ncbi:hypothetical protein SAMN06313486_10144 [Epsilonproteobacteria bacterium SCGC AD-308-P11]|nr:hypothetical protein SAMN06313486_10144 [Epsilonproteobacteria bacterium SCGC AD-308-P11]